MHIQQAFAPRRSLYDTKDPYQELLQEKSSFKQIKKGRFMKNLDDETSWNSLFLNPNTVMEAVGQSYGLTKAEMLDKEVENPAVRIATAETEIINQAKHFLKSNGINVDVFLGERKDSERSNKIILVKNLSLTLTRKKLTGLFNNYGTVSKVLLPKNKALGIVKFGSADHAANAFKCLSGYNIDGTVLYLEWAPMNMFNGDDDQDEELGIGTLGGAMDLEIDNTEDNTDDKDIEKKKKKKA